MLDAGDQEQHNDSYKAAAVIDIIVANVHGNPGVDRCVVLIGYENRIENMLQSMNPGLSRRLQSKRPVTF
jgi:hypothetical protein